MSAPTSPRAQPPHTVASDEFLEYAEPMEPISRTEGHREDVSDEFVEFADESAPVPRSASSSAVNSERGFSKTPTETSMNSSGSRTSLGRRSTIVLKEDDIMNQQQETEDIHDEGPLSRAREGEEIDLKHGSQSYPYGSYIETVLRWTEGGKSVYVTGSFTAWRQMIPLKLCEDGSFAVTLKLAPGTHRLRFVVDGELRCSNAMNTATDSMGNLVNYVEVQPQEPEEDDDMPEEEMYEELDYSQEMPDIFVDPEAFDHSSIEFAPPPQLPPHLEGVILNTNWTDKDNNSVLPIPNHVVLNHLATTSIKHNVLAVASVSRYHAKYVTQILYTPIEGI